MSDDIDWSRVIHGIDNDCEYTPKHVGGKVYVVCYRKLATYNTRDEAIAFYKRCIYASEGSERERYTNILMDLLDTNYKLVFDLEHEFIVWRDTKEGKELLKTLEVHKDYMSV